MRLVQSLSKGGLDNTDGIRKWIIRKGFSGVEAEQLFRDMALTQRLQTSIVGSDKHTLDIKFVDMGIDDIVTNKEWQDDWKHIV